MTGKLSKYKFKSKEALKRLELKRFEKRLHEKRRRAKRRRGNSPAYPGAGLPKANALSRIGKRWDDIHVPKVLDLIADTKSTCDFFTTVAAGVRSGRSPRLLFEDTEIITPESLIYLLAQFHKLQLEYGMTRITGTYAKHPRIARLLQESGFLKVLNVKPITLKGRKLSSTRFVKCKSDTKPDGKLIKTLRLELLGEDLRMPHRISSTVFRALSEAMINVQQHAYKDKQIVKGRRLKGRWWLGAQLSRKNNIFTLTFYDTGLGIPKTLARKYPLEIIRNYLSILPGFKPDDGQMIRAAVELGRSGTNQDHRGKGLLDIHKLIEKVGAGCLTIYSRQGRYKYENSGVTIKNDSSFIEGTLIKWEMPLDRAVESLIELDEFEVET